jgi:hypothetical protein
MNGSSVHFVSDSIFVFVVVNRFVFFVFPVSVDLSIFDLFSFLYLRFHALSFSFHFIFIFEINIVHYWNKMRKKPAHKTAYTYIHARAYTVMILLQKTINNI